MLVIKRITLVSAFVAAPLALWGCSSKNESPQTNPDSGGGGDKDDTDENGAAPGALAAEKAIRGIIGDELYANYNNTEKSRDKDLITRVYNAVIAATKDELGEDAALNALKIWKDGEAVPAPILTYIEKILDGTYPKNPPTANWPKNNIPNPWTPECAKQVADLRKAPATAAIKKAIGTTIDSTDQDKIDATFSAVADYLVSGYTDDGTQVAGLGEAAVNNALSTWKVGDEIPGFVVAALTAYVANQNEEH
jgi:hypothetical protein